MAHGPQKVPRASGRGPCRRSEPEESPRPQKLRSPGLLLVSCAVVIHSQCPKRPSSGKLGFAAGVSGPDAGSQRVVTSSAPSC